MKKLKKHLSVFLALCLTLVYLPLISVSASGTLDEVEKRIEAYDGALNTAEPDADDLAEFEEIVGKYKTLSADEKENMDVLLFDKLYHLSIDREKQVSIINNPDIKASNKQHTINASEATKTNFGGLPAYTDEAIALYTTLNDSKVSSADKLTAFESAGVNARIYAGVYYPTYQSLYYTITYYPSKGFETVVNALAKDMLKAEPFGEAVIKRPTKPNAKNYADGVNDPEYIKDYDAYWAQETEYQLRSAREKNYSAEINLKAMAQVAAAAPEYAPAVDTVNALIEAKTAYDNDKNDTSPAAAVVEKYNALTAMQKLVIDKLSYSFMFNAENKGTFYTIAGVTASKLYTACNDIGNAYLVDEFVKVINSIDEPYTREDIETAKASYALVPSTLVSSIPAEISAKYKAILASVKPDVSSDEKPDISNMPHTDIDYPVSEEMTYKTARNLFNAVLAFTGSNQQTFASDIESKVFSSEFIGTVVKWLYPLLGNASSLVAYSPADLASKLTEDKYAPAVEKLNAAATRDENGKVVKDLADWDNVEFENGDFGFENGDKEAFLDALSACFRQLSLIDIVIKLENSIDTGAGTYTYGGYEDLIPVFEALDLDGIISSDEYTKAVNASSSALKMDARVRPILVPVANLIEEFAQAPLDTILDVLPKLGYAVSSGLLNDQINTLLSKVKMISVSPLDLTSEGLFDLLDGKLNDLIKSKIIKDENSEIKIDFNKDEFVTLLSDLAGCGDYAVRDSLARGTLYRAGIDSNKSGALALAWNYIYGVVADKNNTSALNAVVGALDIASPVKGVVKAVVMLAPRMNSKSVFKIVSFATAILHFVAVVKPYIEDLMSVIKS